MSGIKTEYRGYEIRYVENQDVWRCHVLDMDGTNLTQLKNKISRHLAKMAKVGGIPALCSRYGHGRFVECEIISVASDGKLWIANDREEMWRGAYRVVKDRNKVDACDVVLDTPENREMVVKSDEYLDRIKRLTDEGKEYSKSIPRVDVSTLPTGGDDEE